MKYSTISEKHSQKHLKEFAHPESQHLTYIRTLTEAKYEYNKLTCFVSQRVARQHHRKEEYKIVKTHKFHFVNLKSDILDMSSHCLFAYRALLKA